MATTIPARGSPGPPRPGVMTEAVVTRFRPRSRAYEDTGSNAHANPGLAADAELAWRPTQSIGSPDRPHQRCLSPSPLAR